MVRRCTDIPSNRSPKSDQLKHTVNLLGDVPPDIALEGVASVLISSELDLHADLASKTHETSVELFLRR